MKYLTIEDAVLLTGKSVRTIQRHCDRDYKKGKKSELKLEYPIFTYEKSEKGGRRKLFSEEWLIKRFMNLDKPLKNSVKEKKKNKRKDKKSKKDKEQKAKDGNVFKEKASDSYANTSDDRRDWKDQMIEMLMRDKEALMEDKKALQGIIERLTDNLLLEQKKVAQLEAERMQLLAEKNEKDKASKLSNMSMSEWWAKKQAETVEEDNSSEDKTNDIKSDLSHKEEQIREDNGPKSFTDWLKRGGSR
ncbi:MAG: hypothetical protein D6707_11465 [Bacteroidetes bacterium]|nr:MAG: hypothetical protein D6707_11465 [Bacteroidota bacterium]